MLLLQHEATEDEESYKVFVNLWQNLVTIAENAHKMSRERRMRYDVKPGDTQAGR